MVVSFKENQKVDSIWPLSILALVLVGNWWLYFKMGYQDISFFFITLATISLLCLFLLVLRLQTVIDDEGIHYKMFPFHFKWQTIAWNDIQNLEIRTYRPLKEFGGWGLRFGQSGKAYTISGKTGLQLQLKNGRKVLFGTQKADVMKSYLQEMGKL